MCCWSTVFGEDFKGPPGRDVIVGVTVSETPELWGATVQIETVKK